MAHIPIRSCLACRRRAAKPALVRLALGDGTVALDAAARMPGRGAYLCRRRACLDAALRRDGAPILRALRATGATVDRVGLEAAWERTTHGASAVRKVRQ